MALKKRHVPKANYEVVRRYLQIVPSESTGEMVPAIAKGPRVVKTAASAAEAGGAREAKSAAAAVDNADDMVKTKETHHQHGVGVSSS